MIRIAHATLLALAAFSMPSAAQTQSQRLRDVAIDRVDPQPAPELMVEEVGPAFNSPWSLAFLPDDRILLVEKLGGLHIVDPATGLSQAVEGAPDNLLREAESGLHDVVLDPDFATNGLLYLAYVEGTENANRLAVWRARLDGTRLADGHTIFRSNASRETPQHPGGRMILLPDNTLLVGVGDGYSYRDAAQDPKSHLGKLVRIGRDGSIPPDNPFVNWDGYAPEIYSLGHRNIQGLTLDTTTGEIWSHEHGPRGGDEINRILPGRNYGWPLVLFGIDYDGSAISNLKQAPGIESPRFFWAPSIAPSGLAIYRSDTNSAWNGKLLVGALASRSLVRLRIGQTTGLLVEEERMLSDFKRRIRDVRQAPDGTLYLLTEGNIGEGDVSGHLWRLTPAGD
ncbi:PQQ-dependent sugar dehydrogenase [Altererythrobacter arenosus]|uniref:PQQ-dependent sugar dehydrogenase n=1 Tax=Altererythrobacter arenosus TaxID=3032592 RepID=A0ABY8FW01_9SPHN|nr:PQQ-dependent sugar dehydrogenase [Altererythrobacter sp. CAU 1644]WFL78415.1 PQQ-dependent sugar dehydrogenase [Altererythrobacter sp. CAU 1644]